MHFTTTDEVLRYSQRQEIELRTRLLHHRPVPAPLSSDRHWRVDPDKDIWTDVATDLDIPLRETGFESDDKTGDSISVLSYNMNILLMGATCVAL